MARTCKKNLIVKLYFKNSWHAPAIIEFFATHSKLRKWVSKQTLPHVLGIPINDALSLFTPKPSSLNIIFTSRYFQPEEATFNEKCLFIGPTPTIALRDDTFPIRQLETCNKLIIYATLGTIFNKWTNFYKNFIIRDFVPQSEVLKHADFCIAHGGMSSISDGISLGVPLLLSPLGAEQFFNAYRLQELGACKVLTKKSATTENIKRQAILVLENKTLKLAVKKVQESFITAGGPSLAVREVEKLFSNYPPNGRV